MEFINPTVSQLMQYKQEVQQTLKESEVLLSEQENKIQQLQTVVVELRNALQETQETLQSIHLDSHQVVKSRSRVKALAFILGFIAGFELVVIAFKVLHG